MALPVEGYHRGGAATETELKERKNRIEDALAATQPLLKKVLLAAVQP